MVNFLRIPGFLYQASLHSFAIAACIVAGILISIIQWTLDSTLAVLSYFGASVYRDLLVPHSPREENTPEYCAPSKALMKGETDDGKRLMCMFIDEKTSLAKSKFPLKPDELVTKAKELCATEFGCTKTELLAEDFQFIFPVVGPLDKAEFVKAFSSFKVADAFPDSQSNFFGFQCDPLEPNRVWFMSRARLVHSGTLNFGGMKLPPTGKVVTTTPQVLSFRFDRKGKCYAMTGGYSVDRTAGNSGGLGGLFGVLHAVGKTLPFPEGRPWKPSPEWEAFYRRVPQIGKLWEGVVGGSECSSAKRH